MIDGFVFKAYNDVPIVIDRYPDNSRIRALAIDAVRHPNRPRFKAFSSIHHEWLKHLGPVNLAMLGDVETYFSSLKADFIPRVENPDPAQLERLKDSDLKEVLRKAIEGVKE